MNRPHKYLKQILLYCSKWCGLLSLARHFTRKGLRILCYHGMALEDESVFRPTLFINRQTFQQRLAYLRASAYPVITLEEALQRLERGGLPNSATVITIDDGFYSTYNPTCVLLHQYSFPATVYVTSYYSVKENPVFRLVVQYMFWKTKKTVLDLSGVLQSIGGRISLRDPQDKDQGMWKVIRFGEEDCTEERRVELARILGEHLDVDFEQVRQSRIFDIMNSREIQNAALQGIDIQLHTHRHCLPRNEIQSKREIVDNKAVLEPLVGKILEHFCYPSGIWEQAHWPWLMALGIKSATTCDIGLNYPGTPLLGLKRILDGEHISQIEFEAEMAGYGDFLRWARGRIRRMLAPWSG